VFLDWKQSEKYLTSLTLNSDKSYTYQELLDELD
jgi:hypothetical protein